MSTPITFNGVNYSVPSFGDGGYAQGAGNLSLYLIALASGTLQQTGGIFTLLSDVNFGASFGLVAKYYISLTGVPATAGTLRLSKTDVIDWRNNANSANLPLGINGSDQLTYNGSLVATGSSNGIVNSGTAPLLAYYKTSINAVNNVDANASMGSNKIINLANGTALTDAGTFGQLSNNTTNIIDNGGFEIWQRGTNFSNPSSGTYGSDRWQFSTNDAATVAVTKELTIKDNVGLSSMKVVLSGAAAASIWRILYFIENFADYRGKTVSLSCRVNANVANAISLVIRTDAGVLATSTYHTGGGTFETLSVSATIGAAATSFSIGIGMNVSGDEKNGTYYFDSAMLIIGSEPMAFVATNPQVDFDRCLRFFQVLGGEVTIEQIGFAMADATTQALGLFRFPVTMRVAPTATINNATNFNLTLNTAALQAITTLTIDRLATNSARFTANVAGNLVAGNVTMLQTANTNASIFFSADL